MIVRSILKNYAKFPEDWCIWSISGQNRCMMHSFSAVIFVFQWHFIGLKKKFFFLWSWHEKVELFFFFFPRKAGSMHRDSET